MTRIWCSEQHPTRPEDLPWLDRDDAHEAIDRRVAAGEVDAGDQEWLHSFARDGFTSFENVLDDATIDAINADVDAIYKQWQHLPIGQFKKKFRNIFEESEATLQAMVNPFVLEKLDLILGRRVQPFQTLNLPRSSQQAAHSDEILMTTAPRGYMVAVWHALEDVAPDAGPLKYYRGSHRLPYISARRIGIPVGASQEECGRLFDQNYYQAVAETIAEHQPEEKALLAKRGDMLVWHSNLLHGAHFCTSPEATRRSLIIHHFADDVDIYSDVSQRPLKPRTLRD